jgi:hypothetical protein
MKQDDVADDEEANGGRDGSGGGQNRRRHLATAAAVADKIPASKGAMWMGERSRMLREGRRVDWCAGEGSGHAPFIVARGGRGGVGRSSSSTMLQQQRGVGDDAAGFLASQRVRRA